jgi:hypothetical protein
MSTNEIKGKVYSPLAIDKTLTKEYMCADAKATGDAIAQAVNEVSKVEYHEDIATSHTLYGKGYYLETPNMVIIHMGVSTTSDIKTGEVFAELNKLSKNMQKIDNLGVLDMDGNGYGFKFENKTITAQSDIPQGAKLLIDVCLIVS